MGNVYYSDNENKKNGMIQIAVSVKLDGLFPPYASRGSTSWVSSQSLLLSAAVVWVS